MLTDSAQNIPGWDGHFQGAGAINLPEAPDDVRSERLRPVLRRHLQRDGAERSRCRWTRRAP